MSGIQKIAADSHDLPLLDRLLLLFAQLRYKISQQVIDLLGEGRGHIASALMIGEYHSMDKQLLQNIRGSGLAHLLAVSGMHISIVASVFFFGSRILMAAYMPLVIRYNIKKIAAIIALVGSMGYLFISGMQVSAIRAFIMNFFIILAIILDRSPYPMRSIALAALVIMIWMPHSIFTPGFQMSFAAVASLIFFYVAVNKHYGQWIERQSILGKILTYIIGIILSSILTGLATAPFVIYHFSQCSTYGIISNLIAIPLTVFFIMPILVITFLAMPFNLHYWPLYIAGYGIDLVIWIAEIVNNIPYSNHISHIDSIHLCVLALGGVWACVWQTRIRYIGFIVIIITCISAMLCYTKPDIMIDSKTQNFAITCPDNTLLFSSLRLSSYVKDNWMKYTLSDKMKKIFSKDRGNIVECETNNNICKLSRNGKVVIFVFDQNQIMPYCGQADIIILRTGSYNASKCNNTVIYDRDTLDKTGNVFIWLKEDKIVTKHMKDDRPFFL